MAYSSDQLPSGLETLDDSTIATGDIGVVGDASDGGRVKGITWSSIRTAIATYLASLAQTLTNKTINGSSNTLTVLAATQLSGATPIANGGTANTTAANAFAALKQAASDTATGVVELATIAETTTGTDAARVVTPDGLAGSSIFGVKATSILVFDGTIDVTTGDGKAYITIPAALNGMNLIRAQATVITAGTTNATTIMIHNKTDTADMLSGAISIASAGTVGTVGTINAATDDVVTNDILRVDVDSVSTTAPKGLMIVLEFSLP